MTASCFFSLNGQNLSSLVCQGLGSMPAFSGKPGYLNDPAKVAVADNGPLPPGRYYIVDRQSGGRLGWLKEWTADRAAPINRNQWFALYRIDGKIDDYTFVEGVRRGNFRLHPIGPRGISKGCITLLSPSQFLRLRTFLLSQEPKLVPGTNTKYFGTVDVR
jgi:hypothetical protein